MQKWDKRFMDLAQHVAQWSKDPSTKCGSVVVDVERRVVALGYNGFPRHVNDEPQRYLDREVKYKMIVHAEANAIMNSTRPSLVNCALYATKFPCTECAKLICQSGIAMVIAPGHRVSRQLMPDPTLARWADDAEFSEVMMREAGVTVKEI